MPAILKDVVINALKKTCLPFDNCGNYPQVFNFPFWREAVEHVIVNKFQHFLLTEISLVLKDVLPILCKMPVVLSKGLFTHRFFFLQFQTINTTQLCQHDIMLPEEHYHMQANI